MPASAAKSSEPRLRETIRGWHLAISSMRKKPFVDSTSTANFIDPAGRFRSTSSSSTISATASTCSALSTLVSISAQMPGMTAASISRTSIRQGRLTRTSTSAPLRDTCGMASAISVRAWSFCDGATASSRSRMMPSAPRSAPVFTNLSTLTGTNISERQTGRSSRMELSSLRPASHSITNRRRGAGRPTQWVRTDEPAATSLQPPERGMNAHDPCGSGSRFDSEAFGDRECSPRMDRSST